MALNPLLPSAARWLGGSLAAQSRHHTTQTLCLRAVAPSLLNRSPGAAVPIISPIASVPAFAIRAVASKPVGRDPERPKKPTTAFLHFLSDFRKQRTDLKGPEVMKIGGAEWKNILPGQRAKWDQLFVAEDKVYRQKFDAYVASGKKDAWQRDPLKPKIPMSAYLRFLADFRPKRPELKATEVAKVGGVEWKAMSEAQQKPYNAKYVEEKKAYATALEAYKSSGKEQVWEQKVGIADVKQKALKMKEEADAKKTAAAEKKKVAAEKKKMHAEKKKTALEKRKAQLAKAKDMAVKKKAAATAKKKDADLAAKKKTAAAAAAKKSAAPAKRVAAASTQKKTVAAAKKVGAAAKVSTAKNAAAAATNVVSAKKAEASAKVSTASANH